MLAWFLTPCGLVSLGDAKVSEKYAVSIFMAEGDIMFLRNTDINL
jgi:hypothetical protein